MQLEKGKYCEGWMVGDSWNDEQAARDLKWEHEKEKSFVPDLPF